MPRVAFTQNLRRHLDAPSEEVSGKTVGDALDDAFSRNPRLRGYILDDQGKLRKNLVVFVDGAKLENGDGLSEPVGEASEIYVMQALTGGRG